ncbi:Mn2+ and Fe2+ transporters of the NRAMP family [Fictibacillus solisalsi]|uniref:Mn2+ and Fe2+ transporters of the NRAMP family n=1 Tax=Fictibacillus solisalsi TaxID=459525 RepID=A0A1G9TWH5_9BACL|nr:Nramp family divalent metal transporter [Fictibacillus solisalsi]SDM51754.1 Mn2+ and Fe2+ transporters of the NRAMP family [Fictibacillus solisalsi]
MRNELHMEMAPAKPVSLKKKIGMVGPGLITAATGVGAGDLVAALVAGAAFGMTFVWAIVLGAVFKYFINESMGRFQLATGKTILEGWHSLGRWITGYFGIYSVIFGFVYGAAIASSCALAMTAMFPVLPLWAWAIIHSIVGYVLVLFGRYSFFERIMTVLVGVMFVTVVGTAAMTAPNLLNIASGVVPQVPEGSLFNVLGLIGGVGGTISMVSYGYWLKEKGWSGKSWIPSMRIDSKVAYTVTTIFSLSVLVIGAQFLYGTEIKLNGEQGLIQLSNLLGEDMGSGVRWLFLIGFWSASFTSLLGPWNGLPYLFADFVRTVKRDKKSTVSLHKTKSYKFYLFLLTFPSMLLLFIGEPVAIIIGYGVLGATFMPFLVISLFILLNSKCLEKDYRNNWVSNTVFILCIGLFLFLAYTQLSDMF